MFKPGDFLEVAKNFKDSTKEAKVRTSIGRSYYASFLYAREWLKTKKATFNNDPKDHQLVGTLLRRHSKRAEANKLSKLRRDRNRADYNISIQLTSKEANNAFLNAKVLIAGCN